ncbi:MAG: cation:proton antiporter [Gemmatimonadaceae bacterium]|nr:cation:proton antiporter [Gemmatimonadaceae bacterium]
MMLAAAAEGGAVASLLLRVAAVIFATRACGALARRFKQPIVLGELVAGALLGGSVLGWLDPTEPMIHAIAEIGVIVLLFEIGLETNLRALRAVGGTAMMVAVVGVALPFLFGDLVARAFDVATLPALVIGAALTATSIGISSRVLADLGRLKSDEGQVVLGAAVIDDVIGLVILSVVTGVVTGGAVTVASVSRTTFLAIAFIVLALLVGRAALRPILRFVARLELTGAVGLVAVGFAFIAAALAEWAGSAMIIGAFAAGTVLHSTPQRREVEEAAGGIGQFFVPVFFASVGAAVDFGALFERGPLLLGLALLVVAVVGKVAAGYAPWWFDGNKLLVGVAMVPRGEVGLIFAQIGLSMAVLDQGQFGALMLMVAGSTFLTPPVLSRLAGPVPGVDKDTADHGLAEQVSGHATPRATMPRIPRERD